MKRLISIISAFTLLTLAGCETTGQNTMLGAGLGAGVAAATKNDPLGGAAIGAGAGFLLGKLLKHERERAYDEGYADAGRGYPLAQRTERRGFVISPYRPHHLIDVRGIPRGEKVVDPSCNRVFINP
jgi:hypothetical protein